MDDKRLAEIETLVRRQQQADIAALGLPTYVTVALAELLEEVKAGRKLAGDLICWLDTPWGPPYITDIRQDAEEMLHKRDSSKITGPWSHPKGENDD